MNFHIIETSRLILKGLYPEDMKYIFDHLTKSSIKEILGHRSDEEYLKEEYKHLNGYSSYNRSFQLFLLTEKESGRIIGRCGIHNWNIDSERAEIGYVMHEESFRKKGLMSEALIAIIEHGFEYLKLNRIDALVGVGNTASIRLLEKNNFKKEGVLKQQFKVDGKYEDAFVFAKLLSEYIDEKRLKESHVHKG